MATEKIPLVSVIIPLYNAARFISQTLESLLYQTMQDFEVVVIDDCSTDNSLEVVESFAEKFGGRLHVIKLPENIGGPYLPRNIGIKSARGKYIAFCDNDDFFTKTALEELSTLAEDYQADVVNMPEVFYVKDYGTDTKELLNPANHNIRNVQGNKPIPLEKVTIIPDDMKTKIQLWLANRFHWASWATFVRRNFWVTNRIEFPRMPVSDDMLMNFACLCLAKKVILVPNITYIQRERVDSISRETNDRLDKYFHKWISNLKLGFRNFEKIMSKIPFFIENPAYQYAVLNWFFGRCLSDSRYINKLYETFSPDLINPLIRKEFQCEDAALYSYLFDAVNVQWIKIMQLQAELRKFQQQ